MNRYRSVTPPEIVYLCDLASKLVRPQITTAYGASGEGDQVNAKADGRYDVLHAAIAYLMGHDGQFLDVIHLKDDPDEIAADVAELLNEADRQRQWRVEAIARLSSYSPQSC